MRVAGNGPLAYDIERHRRGTLGSRRSKRFDYHLLDPVEGQLWSLDFDFSLPPSTSSCRVYDASEDGTSIDMTQMIQVLETFVHQMARGVAA